MDLDTYFRHNYLKLQQVANNVTKGHELTQDLFQFCIEIILQDQDKEKIQLMIDKNQLHFYFVALCIRNYNSKTSRFHYLYRKPDDYRANDDVYGIEVPDEQFDALKEQKIEFINSELNNLSWYEQRMVELHFFDGLSYQKISDLTGIPKTSCYNTIQSVKKKINQKYGSQEI